MNRVNSCNDFGHDDSTINIVVVINSININYVGPRICGAKKEGGCRARKVNCTVVEFANWSSEYMLSNGSVHTSQSTN